MTSGGATLNDSFTHGSLGTVPFGGVGDSGWGSYRGKASFDCFTHARTVAEPPAWMDKFMRVRYMPYDWSALAQMNWLTASKPDFDRDGKVVNKGLGYWLGFVFGLGGRGVKGAFLRWILVAAVGYALAARRGVI
jgi:beta-apo-4'-carotenal oxygenase